MVVNSLNEVRNLPGCELARGCAVCDKEQEREVEASSWVVERNRDIIIAGQTAILKLLPK